ncbi:MAG: nitroreductase family protein [Roseiflexaceae bacterium]
MEVFDAVRTLLAVRQFDSRPVPPEVVRQIIDAARLTGSSRNLQPWHFVVVDDPQMLATLGSIARSGPYIAQAPLAIVVLIERTEFAISDASRAIQSMALTAWAAGVGSNWVGWIGFGGVDGARELLGIPDTYDVLAILPFGYPAAEIGQGKKNRKPQDQVISYGRFGQPFGEA